VPSRAKSTRSGTLLVRRISNPFEVIEQIIYLPVRLARDEDVVEQGRPLSRGLRRPIRHPKAARQVNPFAIVRGSNELTAARVSWIKQEQLGHLSAGAVADVAVLRVEKVNFGDARWDAYHAEPARARAPQRQ
jgi:hypothetical protein